MGIGVVVADAFEVEIVRHHAARELGLLGIEFLDPLLRFGHLLILRGGDVAALAAREARARKQGDGGPAENASGADGGGSAFHEGPRR